MFLGDSFDSLDELTDVVTSYVSFCIDTVIPVKKYKLFLNNKPWISKHLWKVLNEKEKVYFLGAERKEVQRAVKCSQMDNIPIAYRPWGRVKTTKGVQKI